MARTPDAPVTPVVLRWAREDAGLSIDDVATRAGVKPAIAAAWEAGEAHPTLAKLRDVADALGRPVAFFLTPDPPEAHATLPPDFRSRTGTPSAALRREIRAAQERRQAFQEINEATSTWNPPSRLEPSAIRDWLGVSVENIKETADPVAALKIWIQAVEARGALVFQMSRIETSECRGFSLADRECPVIMLNGGDAPQARSFTLLHEVAHLLDREGGMCLLQDEVAVERRCNRFASEILMPGAAVAETPAGRSGLELVDSVVRAFRVSPQAAAFRLRHLKLISQSIVEEVLGRAAEAAQRAEAREQTGGPARHLLARRKLGDRYLSAVLDALHTESITLTDATYLLGERVGTIERLERALAGSS